MFRVNVWFGARNYAEVSEDFTSQEEAEAFYRSYEDDPIARAVLFEARPTSCPRCGGPISPCSPSGQGNWACDACHLVGD